MLTRRSILALPAVLAATGAFAGEPVTGAGATFPAPLYSRWAGDAKAIGVTVNYQSIGSGGGINQVRSRTVTFGATDAPLDDPGDLFQFPLVEGSVVPIVNIPGVAEADVKLSLATIAKIFSGKIVSWNDPEIVGQNPGKNMPKLPILPIYRADGSGTTFIWTTAMKSTGQWSDAGTSIKWPVGQGAKGNDGVAATVQRVKGSIGYVEYIYAKNSGLQTAAMDREVRGKTYILLPRNPTNRAAHDEAVRFFEWCMTKGLETAKSMYYYPLDQTEYARIIQEMKKI